MLNVTRFVSFYFAHSTSKAMWPHFARVFSVDGTGVTSFFKGAILGAVCNDANHHLVGLAFLYCRSEDERNVKLFYELLTSDYPGITGSLAVIDKGAGLTSATATVGIPSATCEFHVKKDVRDGFPRVSTAFLEQVAVVARASSEDDLAHALYTLRKLGTNTPGAYEYIYGRRGEFASFDLLHRDPPVFRLGRITSCCESLWKMCQSAKKMGPISMCLTILGFQR